MTVLLAVYWTGLLVLLYQQFAPLVADPDKFWRTLDADRAWEADSLLDDGQHRAVFLAAIVLFCLVWPISLPVAPFLTHFNGGAR